ncbi:MAG TPA: P22 phage major capsid protein family protein [Pseudonocardia sp.]|uniref:P22 phage major capsid protein family protein n=1 Tax=Pseudonocardia sp. TaxID=60912 RepID=UPI002C0C9BD7|nr:P22 phage major capsid protein family protein [Pseudonocardia sp.]HTF53711.1 P22 phage major capsid protein family protein [Pseudonocardia sp.]
MANVFLTPSIIAREALRSLQSNIVAAQLVYRDYVTEFTGAKVGDTVTIRKPATFTAQEFTGAVVVQNAQETGVPLVLEKHFDVTFQVTSKQWTLEVARFTEQLVAPAMSAIAEGVDRYLLSKANDLTSVVTVAGMTTLADLAAIDLGLNENRVPVSPRNSIVSPKIKAAMMGIDAVHRADVRADGGQALRNASLGHIMGIDWYMAQNLGIAIGPGGVPAVVGAVAAGAVTLNLNGATNGGLIPAGTAFKVAGATGTYTTTGTVTVSGTGTATITFAPQAPAGGFVATSVISFGSGTTTSAIAFHPNAFALAVVPLELPLGAASAGYYQEDGMAIRVVRGYDMISKVDTISLDLLVGAKCIDPRLGVKIDD